jgi:hypothetical protein
MIVPTATSLITDHDKRSWRVRCIGPSGAADYLGLVTEDDGSS